MSDKLFKRICITLIALIVIILAITAIIYAKANQLKEEQRVAYEKEFNESLKGDPYYLQATAGELSVIVYVNDSFTDLSYKEQLDITNEYIVLATSLRLKYDRLADDKYVCAHVCTRMGSELVKSDNKGKIKIVQ